MGKAETRERLIRAALELMHERGYEGASTAAIAARAGVSEMTLFRHFPTKAALVVDDPYDPLIAQAIARRPASESALQAAVRGIRDAWHAVEEPDAAEVRDRMRIVANTPALAGVLATGTRATESAIAAALIERATPPARADIVAAAVMAGMNAALLDWARGDDPRLGAALEEVFHALGEDDGD